MRIEHSLINRQDIIDYNALYDVFEKHAKTAAKYLPKKIALPQLVFSFPVTLKGQRGEEALRKMDDIYFNSLMAYTRAGFFIIEEAKQQGVSFTIEDSAKSMFVARVRHNRKMLARAEMRTYLAALVRVIQACLEFLASTVRPSL